MAITKLRFEPGNEKAWLELRNSLTDRIGGSTLGAINNNSKYSSFLKELRYAVGAENRPDISDKIAVMRGHFDEEFVAQLFEKFASKKVHRENAIILNDKYPHLKSSIDRKIANEDAGLECKTANDWVMRQMESDEFPMAYWDQCVSYLATTEFADWYLAILTGNNEFKLFRLTRVKSVADRYAELKKKFVLTVDPNDPNAEEWNRDWKHLDAVYYVDDAEVAGCEARAAYFIGKVDAVNEMMKMFDAEHPDATGTERQTHLENCIVQVIEPHDLKEFDVSTDDGKRDHQEQIDLLFPDGVQDKEVKMDGVSPESIEIKKLLDERKALEDACEAHDEDEEQKARYTRIAEIEVELAEKMGDAEQVTIPSVDGKEWKMTFKLGSSRPSSSPTNVRQWFAAQGQEVPAGLISMSEPKRTFKASEVKAKGAKSAKRTSVPKDKKAA